MTTAPRNIHLVGSVGLADTDAVFRAIAGTVGAAAKRYPDGETGERGYWIRWQQKFLDGHPQFDVREEHMQLPGFKDKVKRSFYRVRNGVNDSDLAFETIGYADHGIESYARFRQLKEDGTIPAGVRFQVSLPTPVAFLSGFIVAEDRNRVEPAYEQVMAAEIDRLVAAIPSDQLGIQWDVCYEVVGHDGGYALHYEDALADSLERLTRLAGYVPEPVELGFHLCYGDPGHKHIIEPQSTATAVMFANGICAGAPRSVNWIHLPVPRARDDAAYFEPLRGLELRPETELYLGLVHHSDGAEGTQRRLAAATPFIADFGLATECGFGRRDPDTIPELLMIHRTVAEGTTA